MRTSRLDWIDQFVIFDFVSPVGHQNLYAMDWARFIGSSETWPAILAGNGTTYDAFGGFPQCGYLESNNHQYTEVIRAGFRVKSGYIPLTANIIAARLKLYTQKQNTPTTPPTFTICSIPTALPFTNNSNYQNVGNIPLSDVVTWDSLPNPGIYPFELNASGILNINLGYGNYSGFSLRMKNFDVDGIEPDISAGPKLVQVVCTGPGGGWSTTNVEGLWSYNVIQSDPNDCFLEVDYESLPLIGTLAASSLTGTAATLNGILGLDGGLSCTCWFEYGLTNAYGNSTVPQVVIDNAPATPGYFAQALTGLANVTYHFRACAQNSKGTVYGADKTFSLLTVTTQPITAVTNTSMTGHGTIINIGAHAPTKRGICYSSSNRIPTTADSKVEETGTYGTGAFSESLTGLDTTVYYLRAYAINSDGTSYGAVMMSINLVESSLEINTVLGQTISTMTGTIHDKNCNVTIQEDTDIAYYDINTGEKIFGGLISYVTGRTTGIERYWDIQCQSYSVLLDRSIVYAAYQADYTNPDTGHTGDQGILEDLFANRVIQAGGNNTGQLGSSEITIGADVIQGTSSLTALNFFYMTLRECIELLANYVGFTYYVDYDKKLHYYYQPTETAPYGLSSSPDGSTTLGYRNINWKRDGTRVINAYMVLGTQLVGSDLTSIFGADGTSAIWAYPQYGPDVLLIAPSGDTHIKVWVNSGTDLVPVWTAQTVGIYPSEAPNWPPLVGDPYDVAWAPLSNTFAYKIPPPAFTNAVKLEYAIPINGGLPSCDSASITNYGRAFFTRLVASDANSAAAVWTNLNHLQEQFRSALEIVTCIVDSTEFPSTTRFEIGQKVTLVNAILGINKSYWIHAITTKVLGGLVIEYSLELRSWTLE